MIDILLTYLAWCIQTVSSFASTQPTPHTKHPTWIQNLFDGFTWAQGGVLAAALIAAGGVMATIVATSGRARRDRLTEVYAEALSGVSQYNEGPYRIRRRTRGHVEQRVVITSSLSDVKARIDHSQNMLDLHARERVAAAYRAYVLASTREAGQQMHEAWKQPGIRNDLEVNLFHPYPRDESEPLRKHALRVMQADLAVRVRKPWTWLAYRKATAAASEAASTALEEAAKKRATMTAAMARAGTTTPSRRALSPRRAFERRPNRQ
jgi:hypothetical protein